jgi:hypothetical protein
MPATMTYLAPQATSWITGHTYPINGAFSVTQ